jgi:formylglycine-generating enzyme required for sulfatase activity
MITSKQIAYLVVFSLLLIGFNAPAQKKTLVVYRSGAVLFEKAVSEIDSVLFYKTAPIGYNILDQQDTMLVYRSGVVIYEKATIEIDSLNFRTSNQTTPLAVTGMLTGTTVQGCSAAAAPAAATTVAALELMPGSIRIVGACTANVFLALSSTDVVSSSCPLTVTRTYTIKDACSNSVTIAHVITVEDTSPPIVTGILTDTTVQGCPDASVPAAATTVAGLELMPGSVRIDDACTAKAFLTVSSTDVISGSCPLTVIRTYTVKDACSNSVAIAQVITIEAAAPLIIADRATIPAGTFTMGSPANEADRDVGETQHTVTLSAFTMSKYEITNAQYAAFLNARHIGVDGLYATGTYPNEALVSPSQGTYDWGLHYTAGQWVPVAGFENHPVIYVTWYGASEFATYAGGRLPTEAEWEYACRAGTATPFNTGNCLSETQANYDWRFPYLNCPSNLNFTGWKTRKVDSYPPNAWGLYNMHGNVWEWCSDRWGPYPNADQTNPTGAVSGSARLIRGGGCSNVAGSCRSGFRNFNYDPDYKSFTIGIRLVFQTN